MKTAINIPDFRNSYHAFAYGEAHKGDVHTHRALRRAYIAAYRAWKEARKEARASRSEYRLQGMMDLACKAQFIREATEALKGQYKHI